MAKKKIRTILPSDMIFLKPTRLTSGEIRTLHDLTELSGRELARLIPFTPQHLSRLEHGGSRMKRGTDKLFRLVCAAKTGRSLRYLRRIMSLRLK